MRRQPHSNSNMALPERAPRHERVYAGAREARGGGPRAGGMVRDAWRASTEEGGGDETGGGEAGGGHSVDEGG